MAKIFTKGILLQKGVGAGPTWTTLAQRLKLAGPSASMGAMEVTDLDSAMEQRAPTLVNPGTITGTLWYDPNDLTHQIFQTDMLAGTSAQWKLIFPDGKPTPSHIVATAFPTKFEATGMEVKGYLQAEFELTCDGGALTYTPGA